MRFCFFFFFEFLVQKHKGYSFKCQPPKEEIKVRLSFEIVNTKCSQFTVMCCKNPAVVQYSEAEKSLKVFFRIFLTVDIFHHGRMPVQWC